MILLLTSRQILTCRNLCFAALACLLLIAGSVVTACAAERFSRVDLALPEADGYGVYAWSPDSKLLAMSETLGGGLVILDVATGKVRSAKFPSFLPRAVAWSPDQSAVVILSNNGFLVVRVSDLTMTDSGSWKPPDGPPSFFGWSVAFSPDGTKLLFDNGDVRKAGPLLYAYDLSRKVYQTILPSPFGNARVAEMHPNNRLQDIAGQLYYVPVLSRPEDALLPPGSDNRTMSTNPATCAAYKLEGDGVVVPQARRDFPPDPLQDTFDGSQDILNCQYMPNEDVFEVSRIVPAYHLDQGTPVYDSSNAFFEAADAGSQRLEGRFGPNPGGMGDLAADECVTDSSQPWAATVVFNPTSRPTKHVVIWNVHTGGVEAQIEASDNPTPQFSPDGKHLSVLQSNSVSIISF